MAENKVERLTNYVNIKEIRYERHHVFYNSSQIVTHFEVVKDD